MVIYLVPFAAAARVFHDFKWIWSPFPSLLAVEIHQVKLLDIDLGHSTALSDHPLLRFVKSFNSLLFEEVPVIIVRSPEWIATWRRTVIIPTFRNIFKVDLHRVVSVRPVLFMMQTQWMADFMNNNPRCHHSCCATPEGEQDGVDVTLSVSAWGRAAKVGNGDLNLQRISSWILKYS